MFDEAVFEGAYDKPCSITKQAYELNGLLYY